MKLIRVLEIEQGNLTAGGDVWRRAEDSQIIISCSFGEVDLIYSLAR